MKQIHGKNRKYSSHVISVGVVGDNFFFFLFCVALQCNGCRKRFVTTAQEFKEKGSGVSLEALRWMKRMKEDVEQQKRLPARSDLCWQPPRPLSRKSPRREDRPRTQKTGRETESAGGPYELTESKHSEGKTRKKRRNVPSCLV